MKILTLCGSLRAQSSNKAVLEAYAGVAPASVRVVAYDSLGSLPPFNPDLDGDVVPERVAAFRTWVDAADVLVISTPEYAHGLPGTLKNALDWLVSHPAFAGKRVVILHIARGSSWALDSLREILRTMSATIVEPACVSLPLGTNAINAQQILARAELRTALEASFAALLGPAPAARGTPLAS